MAPKLARSSLPAPLPNSLFYMSSRPAVTWVHAVCETSLKEYGSTWRNETARDLGCFLDIEPHIPAGLPRSVNERKHEARNQTNKRT